MRHTLWVARVQLVLAALVGLVGIVAALLLQAELWSAGSRWGASFYTRAFELHGLGALALGAPVLAGGLGYAAVAHLVGATRLRVPWLGWLGVAAWLAGIVATIVLFASVADDTGWTFYTPYSTEIAEPPGLRARAIAQLAFAASSLVYAIHLATLVIDHLRAKPVRLATAIVFILAIAIPSAPRVLWALTETAIVTASHSLPGLIGIWTLLAALTLATAALSNDDSPALLVAFALVCGAAMALTGIYLLGLGLVGIWIALAISGGIRRSIVGLVLAGCAPALVLAGLSQLVTDSYLHDTYFGVARVHAIATAILFAALAALAAFGSRPPHPRVTWIATLVTTVGLLYHLLMSVRLGAAGMPRRYWDYDPAFTAGHQRTGLAAFVIILGFVLLAIAWVLGRPRGPTRSV